MGNSKETIQITDEETGEIFDLNITSLVSDIRDRMIARRRLQTEATVWSKLSESQQQDEITAAHNAAFDIIRAAVELVATRENDVIHAQFKTLALDDKGGVKITLVGHADDEELVKINRVGKKVLKITVLDEQQFNEQKRDLKPDADQPEMAFDEDEKPDEPAQVEGPIADQLREAGYDVKEAEDGTTTVEPQEVEDQADSAEPEQEEGQEAEESPDVDPYAMGQEARASGQGPDENPFDGGTEDGNAWAEGYKDADGEIEHLIGQGYDARKDGQAPDRNPWKANSRENGWWQEGYDKAKAEGLPEE